MAKKEYREKKKLPLGAVPDKAYVIALATPIDTVVKSVVIKDGVGVLDYEGIMLLRPEWFEDVKGVKIQKAGFDLDVLATYFEDEISAKVTKVTAAEGAKIKILIAKGKPIAKVFYKVAPEIEAKAKKANKEEKSESGKKVTSGDLADSKEK